ncbi:MAG: ABC transporter ATP-binding protein [Methylocystis sp.]
MTVLQDVDIDIYASEVLLLIGPSGSGKTTLLHILGRLLHPMHGVVELHGKPTAFLDADELAMQRLKHFGFVFQAYNLFPVLTAAENVMVALDLLGASKRVAKDRARELLEVVGLGDRLDAYPSHLSSGQRQRVAIARALAGDPEILMADEPTAALDAENGLKAMELFRTLARERRCAVVIVTHDPRTQRFADRIVHLEDGRIVECSTLAPFPTANALHAPVSPPLSQGGM